MLSTEMVKQRNTHRKWQMIKNNKFLYLLLALPICYYILFHYLPIFGICMSVVKYNPVKGIFGSKYVGFRYFQQFLSDAEFWRIFVNTIRLNGINLLVTFPLPILLAFSINEIKRARIRKFAQSVLYLPHFLSIVVVIGMAYTFLSPSSGIINHLIVACGGEAHSFITDPKAFTTIYVSTTIWQQTGWNSIVFLAAITSIDPQLYEAAEIDGATRLQRVLKVTLPSIMPTVAIMLVLSVGNIITVGFQKVMLLYTPATYSTADILSTYVFRRGIMDGNYGFATAVGLFESIMAFALVMITNKVSSKIGDTSVI